MVPVEFEAAKSWSVSYRSVVYDNARKVAGVWWYYHPVAKVILRFVSQEQVIPLQKNDT